MIVTDAGLTAAGVSGQIEEYVKAAEIECVVFDRAFQQIPFSRAPPEPPVATAADGCANRRAEVTANPTMSVVEAGIKVLNTMPEGTAIVSLGGGSSMDAAKAMSVIGPDGGLSGEDIAAYCMVPELEDGKETINMATMRPKKFATATAAKIIAIPTTSGTASETNGAAVISDDRTEIHRKLIFQYPGAMAQQTILDPELTLGLPAYPTATCGMDALVHSIEALTSARQNPYSDAVSTATACKLLRVSALHPPLTDRIMGLWVYYRSRSDLSSSSLSGSLS